MHGLDAGGGDIPLTGAQAHLPRHARMADFRSFLHETIARMVPSPAVAGIGGFAAVAAVCAANSSTDDPVVHSAATAINHPHGAGLGKMRARAVDVCKWGRCAARMQLHASPMLTPESTGTRLQALAKPICGKHCKAHSLHGLV